MRTTPLIALVFLALGCSERETFMEPAPPTVVGVDAKSKEPRFVFVAPDGFEWNDDHRSWYSEATRTSITPAHAPGTSFQSVVDDFTADRMQSAGMELIKMETRDVDGRPTLVVHGNRINTSYPQQFCTVAYGTTTGCAQITAIYPADLAEEMKAQIETSLLQSKYEAPN